MGNVHFIPAPKNATLASLWSTKMVNEPIDVKVELMAEMLSQLFYGCYLGANPNLDFILLECQTQEFADDFAEKLRQHHLFEDLVILVNDPKTSIKSDYSCNSYGSSITTRSIIGITIRLKKLEPSAVAPVPQTENIEINNSTGVYVGSYTSGYMAPRSEISVSFKIE